MQTQAQKRTVVDIDTRRTVVMLARSRKPHEVAKEGHEKFVRNTLKDRMGWPRHEPSPEVIKQVAKEIAATLEARDKALAEQKAAAAKKAAEAVPA